MPDAHSPDEPPAPTCSWRPEGLDAASVQVSGRVDRSLLASTLRDALRHGRLVLVNLHAAHGLDRAAVEVMVDASARARAEGRRLLLVAAPAGDRLLAEAGRAGAVQLLATSGARTPEPDRSHGAGEPLLLPLDNHVNARVLTARAVSLAEGLWLHDAHDTLHRAWAPPAHDASALSGQPLEVYLDGSGALNGWRDPDSGLAVNQRRLDPARAPARDAAVVCRGSCGVVWRTPTPSALLEHDEHCLTCAGALALG